MTDRLWNWDEPLQRCPEMSESRASNQALRDYAMMGARRSLRSLLAEYRRLFNDDSTKRPPTQKWTTLSAWCQRYDWVARANRNDEMEQARALEEWRERQSQIREQGWDIGQALLKRAEKMLAFPLSKSTTEREEVSPDGTIIKQYITIEPTSWTDGTIYSMAKVANELCRLAAQLETENVRVAATIGFTADDMTEAAAKATNWERERYGGENAKIQDT